MKITVYYEDKNHPIVLDVPDADCEIWIEADYQHRCVASGDKSSITRRTAQEIMDTECNKPTFNSHHKETRRHVSLDTLDPQEDTIAGDTDVQSDLLNDDYADLYSAIEKLRPQQRDLIRKIFWDGLKQINIARKESVDEAAVSGRMARIYTRLKKFLTEGK